MIRVFLIEPIIKQNLLYTRSSIRHIEANGSLIVFDRMNYKTKSIDHIDGSIFHQIY